MRNPVHGLAVVIGLLASGGAYADDTPNEGATAASTCKEIGLRPKTPVFGSCIVQVLSKRAKNADLTPLRYRVTADAKPSTPYKMTVDATLPSQPATFSDRSVASTSTCKRYGFLEGTEAHGQCMFQLDQAEQQARFAQKQYELQLLQYQQQLAAYEAQQKAIKRERKRREGEALLRMSQGVLNSKSTTLQGAINDGLASANGTPVAQPVAPLPPPPQNFTVRLPNGNQVFCNYNSTASYLSCR